MPEIKHFLVIAAILLMGCQAEERAVVQHPVSSIAIAQEPVASIRPTALEQHGQTRIDNYYWLRDDTRSDPQVIDYLEQENAWTQQEMAPMVPLQERLYQEMVGRLATEEASVPVKLGEYWYYFRYPAGQDFPLYARKGDLDDAAEDVLIDGNARAGDTEFYQLANVEVSDDARFVAIAEDYVGRRTYEIRVIDTTTGEALPDLITGADSDLAWSADGQYLFYLRRDPQTLLAKFVMRHKMGTAMSEDVLVYEELNDIYSTSLSRSRSGAWIVLTHSQSTSTEEQLLAADEPTGAFKPFLPREVDHEYTIEERGDVFYILTNWQAKNFRVMSATLEQAEDKSQWQEVVPESPGVLIESATPLGHWLAIGARKDGRRQIWAVDTAAEGRIDIVSDEPVSVMWPTDNVNPESAVLRYAYTSLSTPQQIWEIDLESGQRQLLKETIVNGDYDPSQYLTQRIDITARDGTAIPVSLVYKRDTPLDGSAPGLVYGYGSYGSSTDPYFSTSLVSLLDRGFVYAIAHIRGGQELGREWYEDGKMMNKANTFFDFIDATKALQEGGWMDPLRTYARGASAGGLLMGAVINMAPSLYHGVIAGVPFVDVVTTMLDPSIPLTTGEWTEWGDPREPEAYEYMMSYSPYDQVSAQNYPHLLVTAGLHDSQVQYFEPAKWVAKLRALRTNDNLLLLHTDMAAGHGGASGRLKRYTDAAREYAFLVSLSEQADARKLEAVPLQR